jgi:hypothetical protein
MKDEGEDVVGFVFMTVIAIVAVSLLFVGISSKF